MSVFAPVPDDAVLLLDALFDDPLNWTRLHFFAQSRPILDHITQYLAQSRSLLLSESERHACSLYVLSPVVPLERKNIGEQWRREPRWPTEATETVFLDWLSQDDAALVNDRWPYRHPHSLSTIKTLIRNGPCVGLRVCNNSDPTVPPVLVCWIVLYHYGSIGTLPFLYSPSSNPSYNFIFL